MAEIQSSAHEEIAQLEAKLAAKKQEVLNAGAEVPEKELFKTVIKEHAALEVPRPVTASAVTSTTSATPRPTTPAEEQKINSLITTAFSHGIAAAVREARKENDAYLVDVLHDRLADEFYQKLLAARQVNA